MMCVWTLDVSSHVLSEPTIRPSVDVIHLASKYSVMTEPHAQVDHYNTTFLQINFLDAHICMNMHISTFIVGWPTLKKRLIKEF